MKKLLLIGLATVSLSACTDASFSKLASYGDSGGVVCYSGTLAIYEGRSTGKINNSESSDGYYFRDAATGKLVEVSGNCVIRYAN